MNQISKINIAVAGLGWVATNRHIPIIMRNKNLHLYGVVDKHKQRLNQITRKYAWLKTSLSQEGEMIWADHIQAVLVATDPLNHYKLARKLLLAGKHVLMEKPLTMNPEESRNLIEIAAKMNVSLCVVHNFQFARSTLKLQKMIKDGKLGKLQSIEAIQLSNPNRRLPTWYENLPFGLFYDETPHMLYMLRALAGKDIRHLSSTVIRKANQNTPVSVTGYYEANGLPIHLSMNFEASLSEWHVVVMGSKGIGIVDIFRDVLVTLPNDGLHRAREILATSSFSIATHVWGFVTSGILLARKNLFYGSDIVWEKFTDQINNNKHAEEISAELGLQIVELQHQLMEKSIIINSSI